MKVTRAYNLKVKEPYLIKYLDVLHSILTDELQAILNNPNIQLNSFTEQEYSNRFRGEFCTKLGELTNKNYLNWEHPQKAKYFRSLGNEVRKNFKSIYQKNKIATICSKYNWDYYNNKEKIRKELKENNLYPTFAEVKNICRSQIIPDKHSTFSLKIDYSTQDKQSILQPNELIPTYSFKFVDNKFHSYQFIVPPYINKKEISKFCKPSFFKHQETDEWFITIPYEQSIDLVKDSPIVLGIDIGKIKPFSGRIINLKTRKIISRELRVSKETNYLNKKMRRIENNRDSCYKKIEAYEYILKTSKDKDLIPNIRNKKIRLELELFYLKKKISILKVRLARLMARDLKRIAIKYNISKVKFERLNFVESTGGKWAFSQQQEAMREAMELIGVRVSKVYAAKTSSQNPFNTLNEYGTKSDRLVKFENDFEIDRDDLACINVACRPDNKDEKRIVVRNTKILNAKFEYC